MKISSFSRSRVVAMASRIQEKQVQSLNPSCHDDYYSHIVSFSNFFFLNLLRSLFFISVLISIKHVVSQ